MPRPSHYGLPGHRVTACGRAVEPTRRLQDWAVIDPPSDACRRCLRVFREMTTIVHGGHLISIPPCPGVTIGRWRDGGFIRLLPEDRAVDPGPWLREVALCARSVTDDSAVVEAVIDAAWRKWRRQNV